MRLPRQQRTLIERQLKGVADATRTGR